MNFSFDIQEIVRGLLRPHPTRDWFGVFSVFLIAFLGVVVYATYLFVDIRWGSLGDPTGPVPSPQAGLSRAKIQGVVNTYQTRRDNFQSRIFNLPVVSDPSN